MTRNQRALKNALLWFGAFVAFPWGLVFLFLWWVLT